MSDNFKGVDVGCTVEITRPGLIYSSYDQFVKTYAPGHADRFVDSSEPQYHNHKIDCDDLYTVIAIGNHLDRPRSEFLAVIQSSDSKRVYVFEVNGLNVTKHPHKAKIADIGGF